MNDPGKNRSYAKLSENEKIRDGFSFPSSAAIAGWIEMYEKQNNRNFRVGIVNSGDASLCPFFHGLKIEKA